jgi:hypothetical protein
MRSTKHVPGLKPPITYLQSAQVSVRPAGERRASGLCRGASKGGGGKKPPLRPTEREDLSPCNRLRDLLEVTHPSYTAPAPRSASIAFADVTALSVCAWRTTCATASRRVRLVWGEGRGVSG